MTYAEQLSKLDRDIRNLDGLSYTKEELQTIFRAAKSLMLFAACAIADYPEYEDEEEDDQ
jgi:hypothetical protein